MLDTFSSYPSIENIRRTVKTNEKLSFQPILKYLVHEIFLNLDFFKAIPVGNISADMLKCTVDINPPF